MNNHISVYYVNENNSTLIGTASNYNDATSIYMKFIFSNFKELSKDIDYSFEPDGSVLINFDSWNNMFKITGLTLEDMYEIEQ